jgi:Icc protein
MRIIQITDSHIGREGEDTHGVDVRANFLRILEYAISHQPDYLVFTGDLCFKSGDESIYQWVKNQLGDLNIPRFFLSGNHDDSHLLAHSLGISHFLKGKEVYYSQKWEDRDLLFLDSSSGWISEKQLNWVETQLEKASGDVLLFIHHPLLLANVPFMDGKYPLQNMRDLQDRLFRYPEPVHVFCGHYHVEKVIQKKNITQYITPSCFFQLHPFQEEFRIDHYRIGLRLIDWKEEVLDTTVRYLDGSRLRHFEEDEL